MARVTVEDCLKKMPNQFELVRLAAKRSKQLIKGAQLLVKSDNQKVVLALREIAAGKVRKASKEVRPPTQSSLRVLDCDWRPAVSRDMDRHSPGVIIGGILLLITENERFLTRIARPARSQSPERKRAEAQSREPFG